MTFLVSFLLASTFTEWARETATAAIYRFLPVFPYFFPLCCCCSRIFFSFHFKSINVNDVQLYISLFFFSALFNLYCVLSPPFLFVSVRYNFLYFISHERDFLPFLVIFMTKSCIFWEKRPHTRLIILINSTSPLFVRLISTLILD